MDIGIDEVITKLGIEDGTWTQAGKSYDSIFWVGDAQCTKAEWDTAVGEIEALEPMKVLRRERDAKLAQTDWWGMSDRTMSSAQTAYRTALRDLPSTASPSLTGSGLEQTLTNVTWPTKP